MRFFTEWARGIHAPQQMIDEILKRDLAPLDSDQLIVQVTTPENVEACVTEVHQRLGERYVTRLMTFVALFDENADYSGADYKSVNCVKEGRLTPQFLAGLNALREYFPAAKLDAIRTELSTLQEQYEAKKTVSE